MARLTNELFKNADDRSRKYLRAVCNNIGLLGINHGWDSVTGALKKKDIEFENVINYSIWANLTGSGQVEVYEYYKDNEQRYAAEYCQRAGIDDYDITSYVYNRKPSKKTIIDTKVIEDIDFELTANKAVLKCWECGHECHFADIKADSLEQKFDRWKDSFCGRCDWRRVAIQVTAELPYESLTHKLDYLSKITEEIFKGKI